MLFSASSVTSQEKNANLDMAINYSSKQPITAGILLGVGLGGFFDGIVLHQLLQWHHMVSAWHPPTSLANLQLNTLWDGIFHVAAYLLMVVGVFLLWRSFRKNAGRWFTRTLVACLLIGWGIFKGLEGLIDHQFLGVHHVRDDLTGAAQLAWDIGFLISGIGLVLTGWLLLQQDKTRRDRVATFSPAQKANSQK
jgi:uncharacterized membrane protein